MVVCSYVLEQNITMVGAGEEGKEKGKEEKEEEGEEEEDAVDLTSQEIAHL